tara:strand:- start:1706 stop:1837 length:132 start_codon:yes stop_codon:yes gene_type:complete
MCQKQHGQIEGMLEVPVFHELWHCGKRLKVQLNLLLERLLFPS